MNECGCRREIRLFLRHVNKTETCWLWTGSLGVGGYGRVVRNAKNIRAHRRSYELFKGPVPKGKFICHSCDVRHCVNPSHLWPGTAHDNIQDAYDKGIKMGYRAVNPSKKLTLNIARRIRILYKTTPLSRNAIARKFSVCKSTIDTILSNKYWREQNV